MFLAMGVRCHQSLRGIGTSNCLFNLIPRWAQHFVIVHPCRRCFDGHAVVAPRWQPPRLQSVRRLMRLRSLRLSPFVLLCAFLLPRFANADDYFPPPDSEGGWRTLSDPAQIRALSEQSVAGYESSLEELLPLIDSVSDVAKKDS